MHNADYFDFKEIPSDAELHAFKMLLDPNGMALIINDFVDGNKDLKEIDSYCSNGYDINNIPKTHKDKIPYFYKKNGVTMLHYFTYRGLPGFLSETIKQYGENNIKYGKSKARGDVRYCKLLQVDSTRRTAIHYACSSKEMSTIINGNETRYVNNWTDVVKILIKEGFEVCWIDKIDKTPFDTLIDGFPTYNLVKVFVENGAEVEREHEHTVANKLVMVRQSLKAHFDENGAALYGSSLPSEGEMALLNKGQLDEARIKAYDKMTDYIIMHEKTICHKINDLLAVQLLLNNPNMSIEDKMVLDKISVCNTECIRDFKHAKQKFGMQFPDKPVQEGGSQWYAVSQFVRSDSRIKLAQDGQLALAQDNRTAKPVTLESILKNNTVSRITETAKAGKPAQSVIQVGEVMGSSIMQRRRNVLSNLQAAPLTANGR